MRCLFVSFMCCVLSIAACNRNVEPFVEGEEPREPNLARIFPEGAEAPGPGLRGPRASGEMPAPRGDSSAAVASASGAEIQGTLEVAEALAGDIPPAATLFLIARRDGAAGGPPLAVRRIASPSFPMAFAIGPQHVMIQGMPFAGPIRLTARLDTDGDAMTRQPGDLSGTASQPSEPGASGVRIVLDERN